MDTKRGGGAAAGGRARGDSRSGRDTAAGPGRGGGRAGRAAGGCWSSRPPAGASRRSTGRPPPRCARPARGPTLVVSPLLALMRDQVAAAEPGRAARGHRQLRQRRRVGAVLDALGARRARRAAGLPRAARQPPVRRHGLPGCWPRPACWSIDEAHCISDWGFDFRPDYQRLTPPARRDRAGQPVLATTATANARVTADVAAQLGADTLVLRGPLARASLRLAVVPGLGPAGALRLGRRRARRAARLRDRLRADRGRGRARWPAFLRRRRGTRSPPTTGQTRAGRAGPDRGRAAGQRAQGGGGDLRARHGLRQARPRLLHARRLARLPGGLLPAGRPGRPGARRRGRPCCCRRRERRADLGVLRHRDDPRPGRAPAACSRCCRRRRGRADVACRRSRPRPGCAAAGSRRC